MPHRKAQSAGHMTPFAGENTGSVCCSYLCTCLAGGRGREKKQNIDSGLGAHGMAVGSSAFTHQQLNKLCMLKAG